MENRKVYLLLCFLLICLVYFVNLARSESHFVLVHTAGHGAWCWYKLVPLLRSSGHNVTALDLAASGINPKHVLEVPSISDYFRPLTELMASLPQHEKVIIIGHSYGGLAISHAMERFPEKISVAVFITALMPGPYTNFSIFFQETHLAGDLRVLFSVQLLTGGEAKIQKTSLCSCSFTGTKYSNPDWWGDVSGALLPHLRMLMMPGGIERLIDEAERSDSGKSEFTGKSYQTQMLVPASISKTTLQVLDLR
ncbi:Methylketone synthase Ib [Abeliophyllum distichum]|uniref:Methylketone synthase Ib n=1 Tax=Abeliophyllum distichum TaxID=126358 RepID=A0ABD1NW87_9LAMI